MSAPAPKLLITGGTGVLGPALIDALGAARCVALCHRTPPRDPSLETVHGDLTKPQLGLDQTSYERLLAGIDGIVHAGALTSSLGPAEEVHEVNVGGTQHIVELAERAQVPLHHISTFYVCGRDGTPNSPAVDSYQSSKRAAETLVEHSGAASAIYRLPILIGDERTGAIPRFSGQAIYLGAKAIVSGNAHVMPAAPVSYFDFLPCDYVARCLAAAIEGGARGVVWITAGEHALPFAEFVDICVQFAEELGRPIVRPKLVAPDVIDRLMLPAFGDTIPARLRRQLEIGNQVMLGMANETHLPDSRRELPDGVELPPLPDLRASLRASLRYWEQHTTLPRQVEVPELVRS